MPFGLPAIGEGTWGQKILDSINAVKATADAAQVAADLEADVAATVGTDGALDTALSATIAEQANPYSTVADLPAWFLIGHRGGAGVAPEHTFAAYDLALAHGADALELDAYLLTDGTLAVAHDTTIDRVANATGNVADFSSVGWKNLTVDAATWFGAGWPDQGAPLLVAEALARYGRNVRWFIEVKTTGTATVDALCDVVSKCGMVEQVVIASFLWTDVTRAVENGFHAMFLDTDGLTKTPAEFTADGVEWSGCGSASAATVAALQAAGVRVVDFTPNNHLDTATTVANGYDGMFTDQLLYANGAQNGYSYRQTTAPWTKDGRLPVGMIDTHAGSAAGNKMGMVGSAGAYRLQPKADHRSLTLMGWACPLASPTNYTLTMQFTVDTADSDTTSWGGVYFSYTTDPKIGYNAEHTGNGYLVFVRQTGNMILYRSTGGAFTVIGSLATTAAITTGGSATIEIDVTPTDVTVTRTDSGGFAPITVADATHRGSYVYGRLNTKNAGLFSYGPMTIT